MTEPDSTTAPDAQSVGELPASTEPRRQLFRRRPAESQPIAAPPDGSDENTMIMAAPQPTEIISAEESAQADADGSSKKLFRRNRSFFTSHEREKKYSLLRDFRFNLVVSVLSRTDFGEIFQTCGRKFTEIR